MTREKRQRLKAEGVSEARKDLHSMALGRFDLVLRYPDHEISRAAYRSEMRRALKLLRGKR